MKKPKTPKAKKHLPESAPVLTKMSYRSAKHRATKLGMPFGFENFQDFHEYMGPRPSRGHTLDRIDNGKGYVRGNLRWATKKEQAENRSTTIRISFEGKTLSPWEFAQLLGVSVDAVYRGLRRGESPEQIAFHAREASAAKTVPEPWPWPVGHETELERSYQQSARATESREKFLQRVCKERMATLFKYMARPQEPIGIDEETGEPIYASMPAGFTAQFDLVRRWLADAEAKLAAAERRAADPFGELFRSATRKETNR